MTTVARACLLIGLTALPTSADRAEIVNGTSGARTPKLGVHPGGLVVREGSAGSGFGTVRAGKGKRRFAYFVLFKHKLGDAGEGETACSEDASAGDEGGSSTQTIQIAGHRLTIAYRVELDRRTRKVRKEVLTLNGKDVDPRKGRVFVVDLTVSPPRWEQKRLRLPDGVPDASRPKDAEALAKKTLADLARQDRSVRAFLDAAGR
jgi:hypothetical protein